MCSRLCVCALLPTGRASEVRQRAQSVRSGECQQNVTRPVGASTRGRCELHGIRSRRSRSRPRVRLRECHLLFAATNSRPPEPVSSRQRRDCVHADAASSQHGSQLEILTTGNSAIGAFYPDAASIPGASALQTGHESLGQGRGIVDMIQLRSNSYMELYYTDDIEGFFCERV